MPRDVSKFVHVNATDTCSVWNVLSSLTLYRASKGGKIVFCCTGYVHYECIRRPRKSFNLLEQELQKRLQKALTENQFSAYPLELRDLQNAALMKKRKNLGLGELATLAFAMKAGIAFLTDDRGAQKFAVECISAEKVQTTPHLLGWLFFESILTDGDKSKIISEHSAMGRPLASPFEEMYIEALRCRLLTQRTITKPVE